MALKSYQETIPVGEYGNTFELNIEGVNGGDEAYKQMPGVNDFTVSADVDQETFYDMLEGEWGRVVAKGKTLKFSGTMYGYKDNPVFVYLHEVMLDKVSDIDLKSKVKWTRKVNNTIFEAYVLMNVSSLGGEVNGKIKLDWEFIVDGKPSVEPIEG